MGGLLIAGVFRSVINHHVTFSINSITHKFGSQPYSDNHSARDNWFTAILTFGEGYHNYHHEFPTDYRNGVKHHQYDPSKWLIRSLSYLGLTYDLIKVAPHTIKRKEEAMTAKRLKKEEELIRQGEHMTELKSNQNQFAKNSVSSVKVSKQAA